MRRVDCFCCHAVRGTEWATIYPQSPWPAGTIASQTPVLGCSRQKEIQHFTWKLVLVTYKKMQKARCEHFEEGILLSRHVREPATIFCSHHGNFSWYYFSTNLRPSVILKNIPLQDRKCIQNLHLSHHLFSKIFLKLQLSHNVPFYFYCIWT